MNMKRNSRALLACAAAALSALLLWAVYPPMGEVCALAFALAPLLAVARLCAPARAARAWFLGGFLFWFATLAWMPALAKNNGPLPLVVLGWAGLSALCAAYWALFGWLAARVWRSRAAARPAGRVLLLVFVEPCLWAGLEWVRSWLFTGFAWNFLGTAVGQIPPLAAPARLGGVYLVSALVVLLNGVFATLACRLLAQMLPAAAGPLALWRPEGRRRWGRMCETALPLAAVLLACALARLPPAAAPSLPVRVALVQRNAPCIFSRRDRAEDPHEVFGRLLTTAAAARPDLVVWAESAMAEFGPLDGDGARRAAWTFARQTGGASLLAGGDWWFTAETGERRAWNAAGLYTPTATNVALQVYGKQHLVPFGEYIPFDKWIPPLQHLSPVGVSLWPGEAKTFRLRLNRPEGADAPALAVAPLICFEDTDPVLARKAARLGAQLIVLITNDSWFSHSQEPVQHAWQAVLRAVETGLPVVRVGNSGVTGLVFPSGRARWLEDGDGNLLVDAAGTMVETVPVAAAPVRTPYVRFGDLPLALLFAACLAFAVCARRADA